MLFNATVDARPIAPRERHPLIFSTFQALPDGGAMQLVNDHDPQPLFDQFQEKFAGKFNWEYIEKGPETWRVRIGKPARHCCGGCL